AFADQLQVSLDAAAFVALTDDGGAFKPNPALDRLRDLTAHRGDVTVHARLVISSFGELSEPMLDDAKNLQHPILDALGGNDHAVQELRNSRVPVEIVHPDSKPADTDRSIVDSDSEQDAIVQNIVAGNSLVVRALPGTGATQTVVNALGALVSKHKRVLLVTPRTATSDAIKDRLAQVGLQGMAVELSKPARDIIASIGRNEKAKKPSLGQVDQAYERLRKVILKYREALAKKDATLGVSALECFTRLGTLSLRESPPETTARLDAEALVALSPGLGQAAELLRRAAELGEFKYGPADSPWYGVTFANVEDARKSQERARRLSTDAVPRLLEKFPPLLEQTPLPSVTTIGQMGVFVHLLMDMRDTLDRFQPSVFDRSLKDLITATGPKELAKTMPRLQRQRLKGLAKEHVRPGVSVPDLHESLVKIQSQRELWNRYVDTGHQPSVPAGLADVHVLVTQIEQDLQELDRVLGRTGKGERLADMPALQMLTLLEELAQESEILQSLERRREVQDHLEQMHLGPLV
ncbi:MAG: AAA family ATPase, partial [Pontimonas sp.]|nr:AAA family ATPase [Pontimonas sp.]